MDGQVREIPGYYYDRDKKKYFKIQASSAAPASSAYSSFDVKRRKLEDSRSEAEKQNTSRQKGRIRVSRVQENLALNGLFAQKPSYSRLAWSESLVSGFVHCGSFRRSELTPRDHCPLFMASPKFDSGPSMVNMRLATNILALFRIDQSDLDTYGGVEGPASTSPNGFEIIASCDEDQYWAPMTEVTSLSANKGAEMYTRTWLSDRADAGISIVPGFTIDDTLDQGYYRSPTILIGPGLSRGREVSIFSSTPAPPASALLFAYGTSHGIMTVEKTNLDGKFISPKPSSGSNNPTDVFSLEFLADNHSVLLSGGRRGILNITDLRIPKFGTDADTITHLSSITHIKQIDSHRILVAGLNSSLRQYDLRFRKFDTPSAPPRKRKKLRSPYNSSPTRSILEYPGFHNTANIQHGLDIEPEIGVVAVCQEHDNVHPPVQVFSLHGGHKIRVPALEDTSNIERDQVVRCLQWVDDIENRTKSLWVGYNGGIDRYAWTGPDDFPGF